MGGSGASGLPPRPTSSYNAIKQVHEAEQQRLDSDVNEYLGKLLSKLNMRNAENIQGYLNNIRTALGDNLEIEQFLFGGSVAKHTYVDGLSDIDALAIMKQEGLDEKSPKDILIKLFRLLKDNLKYENIRSIRKGDLAVTVKYKDGNELQLLPAIQQGTKLAVSEEARNRWNITNPKSFQRELTISNKRLNHSLVPVIKIVKSINSTLPVSKQLKSYHIESLSLEVFKGYQGAKTPKALLTHFYSESSARIKSPIVDKTGQSRIVDEYLGKTNSTQRKDIANTLAGIARRLNAATSVDQWKNIIEG